MQADLARHLMRGEPLRLLGNSGLAVAVVYLMRDVAPLRWMLAWLAVMLATSAFHAWKVVARQRQQASGEDGDGSAVSATVSAAVSGQRLRSVTVKETGYGLLWMAAELIIVPHVDYAHRGIFMVLLSGLGAGQMQSLCAHLPALYGNVLPVALGFLVAGYASRGPYYLVAYGMLFLWLAVNLNYARLMRRSLVESLQNHHMASALALDLERERDRALALGKSRSNFLAAASHDLRQPVHALSLLVAALNQGPPHEQARVLLGHVGSAVDAMGQLFNSLLDISKLDAELVQPQAVVLDLRPLLDRLAREHALLAAAKGLAFEWRAPDTAALVVCGDPVLLERVLRNLLSNALRYTAQGGVQLRARSRHGRVELVVADSGVGIPKARREEVFQEFVQLDPAANHSGHSLGLGLSIVRRLVDLMGLPLRLISRPGRGTLFTLRLPLSAALPSPLPSLLPTSLPAPLTGAEAPAGHWPVAPPTARTVVLVIDDSAEIRVAMCALLASWQHEVYAAASVDELMPQLMGLTVAPSLIVCDHGLRDGDSGIDAVAQLRELFNAPLPALLVTGDTSPERLREAVASGLPLLLKPLGEQALRKAMAQALAA